MSIATTPASYTPDDLLKMPDGDRYELVNGQLVERNMSTLACFVAGIIYHHFASYCFGERAGWPFPEGTTYQCFPGDPNRVRKANVSVFQWQRRTIEEFRTEGHCRLAPDLVVEVVSPNDEVYEVAEKVQEWLAAGVRLVWVVNPLHRTVEVHRGTGAGTILRASDELTGEDVVPGFRCRVGELFEVPAK
jgi:Uma2 family endonuclease